MSKSCYLSGLGLMGRRHLRGLLRSGFNVVAFDPSEESAKIAIDELVLADIPTDGFKHISKPSMSGNYHLAIFAETARYRFENVSLFLKSNYAQRFLLEKPLSANPTEVDLYHKIFTDQGIGVDRVMVNYPRRTWPYVKRLKEMAQASKFTTITINGGSFGFGCNGIHYIDMFIYIVGAEAPSVKYSKVDHTMVESGRGVQFSDFGGEFLASNSKGSLYCSGSSSSSSNVVMSVVGDHFYAWIDERDLKWRLMAKSPESDQPLFRFGWDYEVKEEDLAIVDSLEELTSKWALEDEQLPDLNCAIKAHHLLHEVLENGGIKPPFKYT